MKPPWQVVNLSESPAANGKQGLVHPVPIQTPYLLMGREGEAEELPRKAVIDPSIFSPCLCLFPYLCHLHSFNKHSQATSGQTLGSKDTHRSSVNPLHPNFSSHFPPGCWGKGWYALTLQLGQPDTASVLQDLPSRRVAYCPWDLLGFSPIGGMLLL